MLIIGLGNIGDKYTRTRHNAGFLAVDFLRTQWGLPNFAQNKKCHSLVSIGTYQNTKIIIAKPTTLMNLSGEAVVALMHYYKIAQEDIIILHDDFDITLGKYKIAHNSRSAGHRGVQNIFDLLKTQQLTRIRIGVRTPQPEDAPHIKACTLALQNFTKNEYDAFTHILPDIRNATESLIFT